MTIKMREAHQFYDTWCKEHKKGLDNGNRRNFQLIRREEYVVEEGILLDFTLYGDVYLRKVEPEHE